MNYLFDLFRKEEILALKSRIADLEEEHKKLLLQLEKKEEKTKRTVSSKQEVDRELTGCRQKITSLENELSHLKKESVHEVGFYFSEMVPKGRIDGILFLLSSMESSTSSLITIYLANDDILEKAAPDAAAHIKSSSLQLIGKIESSTGMVIFYDTNRIVHLVIVPVFPVVRSECTVGRRFILEPLKNSLQDKKTLVLNVHAGETFTGILDNDRFVEHKIVRSSVMGKHSKGGWSQKRFERLIEEDIKHHADKVKGVVQSMKERHEDIQFVIAGGEGKLVRMILEGYDYPVIMKAMAPFMNTEQVLRDVLAVRVYGI